MSYGSCCLYYYNVGWLRKKRLSPTIKEAMYCLRAINPLSPLHHFLSINYLTTPQYKNDLSNWDGTHRNNPRRNSYQKRKTPEETKKTIFLFRFIEEETLKSPCIANPSSPFSPKLQVLPQTYIYICIIISLSLQNAS